MVVDKRAFDKLDEPDRQVFRQVMTAIYETFEQTNRIDNEKAAEVLRSNGLQFMEPDPVEVADWRERAMLANRTLWNDGKFTADLLPKLLETLGEFRAASRGADGVASVSDR
jgi:TRAP-type C4-dicarboxylate transport system substrate-binding protein